MFIIATHCYKTKELKVNVYGIDNDLKHYVFQGICLVFGLIGLILSWVNYYLVNDYFFAAFELCYSLFSFYLLFLSIRHRVSNWQIYVNAFMLTFLILYGIASTKISSGLIYWSFCLPAVYHIFFSLKKALLFISIIFCTVVFTMFSKTNGEFAFPILNYSFLFLGIWSISCAHEFSRIKVQQRLQEAALTDELTGAKNRLCLTNDIMQSTTKPQNRFAISLDIDHFKSINDNYGHQAGDLVLTQFATRLKEIFSSGDVYRMGGEEFLVIVSADSLAEIKAQSKSACQRIAQTSFQILERDIELTASIGVAPIQLGEEPDAFLALADQALYRSKREGRNRVSFA